MIEIPEAQVLSDQLNRVLAGRTVIGVVPWRSPHKLAFVYQNPQAYTDLFKGEPFQEAAGFGSWVEVRFRKAILAVSEGTVLFHTPEREALPAKHQLLLEFDDGSFLCAAVRMYGAVVGAPIGAFENRYYRAAREAPPVFSQSFFRDRFPSLLGDESLQNLSLKAFMATEQRIPGLGNGVLQDILFNARLHPRTRVKQTSPAQRELLLRSTVTTLKDMTLQGGRDTEKDLFGRPGGYETRMSRHTVGRPCPVCGQRIEKASYMGGAITFCPACQPVPSA